MTTTVRMMLALALGWVLATWVPFARHWIPVWIWRMGLFSLAGWWLLPMLVPRLGFWSAVGHRKAVEIREGEVSEGQQWFTVRARPATLPKRVTAWGVFYGVLAAFLAVVMTPPHSAFVGDGMSHFVVFLLVGVPTGALLFRYLANRTRRLVAVPFAVSADAVRLPNGRVVPRDKITDVQVRNTQRSEHVMGHAGRRSLGADRRARTPFRGESLGSA